MRTKIILHTAHQLELLESLIDFEIETTKDYLRNDCTNNEDAIEERNKLTTYIQIQMIIQLAKCEKDPPSKRTTSSQSS